MNARTAVGPVAVAMDRLDSSFSDQTLPFNTSEPLARGVSDSGEG